MNPNTAIAFADKILQMGSDWTIGKLPGPTKEVRYFVRFLARFVAKS
jgi:hypothetical protein